MILDIDMETFIATHTKFKAIEFKQLAFLDGNQNNLQVLSFLVPLNSCISQFQAVQHRSLSSSECENSQAC